ncbi:hypothetical protein G6F57_023147 [Rhizopus arrhizus]|nr:hypothetical protein G6F57_023147 [Rhizopus arrhizus]
MYSSDMNDGPTVDESESTTPGDEITPPVDTPLGKMGSQICYDLRYPEISIKLRNKGAEILTFPSAFTPKTGAHWGKHREHMNINYSSESLRNLVTSKSS